VKLPIAIAILSASSLAAASPAYELAQLLHRAQTVALVTIDAHDGAVHAKHLYRGKAPRALHIDPAALPKDVDLYVALSQGDKPFGPPTGDAQVGQGTEGQRGYRGWLLYPVRGGRVDPAWLIKSDGDIRVDHLRAFVAKHPYRESGE
jgi:hypothetical protein